MWWSRASAGDSASFLFLVFSGFLQIYNKDDDSAADVIAVMDTHITHIVTI